MQARVRSRNYPSVPDYLATCFLPGMRALTCQEALSRSAFGQAEMPFYKEIETTVSALAGAYKAATEGPEIHMYLHMLELEAGKHFNQTDIGRSVVAMSCELISTIHLHLFSPYWARSSQPTADSVDPLLVSGNHMIVTIPPAEKINAVDVALPLGTGARVQTAQWSAPTYQCFSANP